MTTKFKLIVNGNGRELSEITQMVGNHNSGKASIDLEDITGYLKARKALYPSLFCASLVKPDLSEPSTIHLSDDDSKTFYLTIQECIYEELVMPNDTISNPVLDQYAIENLSQAGEQC